MARSGRRRSANPPGRALPRQAILDATVASLAEHGFGATSARAVAERAGIAPGGVFYHFGSMDELLAEVYDTCNDARIRRLAEALAAADGDVATALADAARDEFQRPSSRALLELVVGSIDSPLLAERVRAGVDRSIAFTKDAVMAVAQGSPAASLLPLDLVAELAVSAYFGLEVLDHVGRRVDLDALASLIRLLTVVIAAPPPTPPITRPPRGRSS